MIVDYILDITVVGVVLDQIIVHKHTHNYLRFHQEQVIYNHILLVETVLWKFTQKVVTEYVVILSPV